jgi:nucleoside-diphosphate-sugar epimerase
VSSKLSGEKALLVTGSTGFVGGMVARTAQHHGFASVFTPGRDWSAVPWARVTHVAHCAAVVPASVQASRSDASGFEPNVDLTARLLDHLRKSPVDSFAFISSISVYDKQAPVLDLSEDAPLERSDPYALSKIRSEEVVRAAAAEQDFGAWLLRASSVYGRGMNQSLLLPSLCRAAAEGGPLKLFGPRDYTQNFIHVEDLADVILAALVHRGPAGDVAVLNAFSDDSWLVGELASTIAARLSPPGRVAAVEDNTSEPAAPRRTYPNDALKARLPVTFRRLEDSLRDVIG